MRIYTKTGDDGHTGLFGGARVEKSDLRVECYGTVDELGACLGVAIAEGLTDGVASLCIGIQNALFVVGAELASVPEKRRDLNMRLIDEEDIAELERAIDRFELELPKLSCFILSGGRKTAAYLHVARTVCRRAERLIVSLSKHSTVSSHLTVYLNRLSDLLFVMARVENHRQGAVDVPFRARS